MSRSYPLLNGALNSPLAYLSKPLKGLPLSNDASLLNISRGVFLSHVMHLAQRLPNNAYAVNLCYNRYLFLVSCWAVIVRGQSNLLPPNKNPRTQSKLIGKYANTYAIHDGDADLADGIESFDLSKITWPSSSSNNLEVPEIAFDHPAIISFTSGSTGESKPNLKTWQTLVESSAINAKHMLPNSEQMFCHLATVPGQHMWGLETSVLLPVFANACLVDAQPMFPNDILNLIRQLPKPVSLISTPLHLRAITLAKKQEPSIEWSNTLCATAPLNRELAVNLEQQFNTQVREVYGCSEVGSMAVRFSAYTEHWQQFIGLSFDISDSGTLVNSNYLPAAIALEDVLKQVKPGYFTLAGRLSDQIKIAGKRGSLHEVNSVLNAFDGALDGVVIFPGQNRLVPRLIAMVVLKPGVDKNTLRDHFREHLDAAFVPRPIYIVDTLPREENGKLIKANVLALYDLLSSNKGSVKSVNVNVNM